LVVVACLGLALYGRLAQVLGGHVRLVVMSTLTLGTVMARWLNIQRYARSVGLASPTGRRIRPPGHRPRSVRRPPCSSACSPSPPSTPSL